MNQIDKYMIANMIKQKIRNISSKMSIWASAIPMVILFIVMTFVLIPKLQELLGNMQLLDTSFGGYDALYVHRLFDKLGNVGRKAYLSLELYADIPYIFLYVITLTTLIIKLLLKNGLWNSKLSYSLMFPVFAGVFDFAEDIGVISLLTGRGVISERVVKITSICTNIKGLFLGLTLLTILFMLCVLGFRRFKRVSRYN